MGGPLEPRERPGDGTDPSQLRISDADRHQVAELLREAAGEGRLDLEELDERLEATYAAKTYADLVPITIDLPVPGEPAAAPVQRRETAARPPRVRDLDRRSWAASAARACGWCGSGTRRSR